MTMETPVRVLIAALGGEGGGVLAGWISEAAVASGLLASRTSIPGVAQRTGATTYYIEITQRASEGQRPVLALNPVQGEVDVVLASELLEAARMVQAGFVSPDRTTLVASTHRVFTTAEKMEMGDGRLDARRLTGTLSRHARRAVLDDYAARAVAAGAPLNAVLLGALAGSGALPLAPEALRSAIRSEGKSVAANLAGFEAGMRMPDPAVEATRESTGDVTPLSLPPGLSAFPDGARSTVVQGWSRLADYQDEAYAGLFLERVGRFAGRAGADAGFLARLARNLAVRMSFEDTIRVAELKIRELRLAQVRAEAKARPGDIVDITEYLKPGPEEILSLLPPALARRALAFVDSRGWLNKAFAMKVRTTRPGGLIRMKLLAGQKRRRRNTLRFHEENAWIERWLGLVEAALAVDPAAAGEIVESAKLVRGYGDTYKRGTTNWQSIAREVIEPGLSGGLPRHLFADAVLQARLAAEKDPDGSALAATITSIRASVAPATLAAQ